MKELNKDKLLKIKGGDVKMSAALINAINKPLSFGLDLGRYLGSSLRRLVSRCLCKL